MTGALSFGGTDLTRWLEAPSVERPVVAEAALDLIDVPGRDGALLNGGRLRPLVLTVSGTLVGDTAAEVEASRRALAGALLSGGETRRLVLPDDDAVFYDAVLSGSSSLSRGRERPRATLRFSVPDACGWGAGERSATIAANYAVTLDVGGNAATRPTISATALRASVTAGTSHDGARAELTLSGLTAGDAVAIDMSREAVEVNGLAAYPSLASDYWALAPGRTEVFLYGAEGTVTWRERWV